MKIILLFVVNQNVLPQVLRKTQIIINTLLQNAILKEKISVTRTAESFQQKTQVS